MTPSMRFALVCIVLCIAMNECNAEAPSLNSATMIFGRVYILIEMVLQSFKQAILFLTVYLQLMQVHQGKQPFNPSSLHIHHSYC